MKAYNRKEWIDFSNSDEETPLEFCIGVAEFECFDGYAEEAKEELNCLRENIAANSETIAYLRHALDAANEKLLYVCGESAPIYSEETGREFLKAWYEYKLEEMRRIENATN